MTTPSDAVRAVLAIALVAVACKNEAPVGSADNPLLTRFVDELGPADHDRELRVTGTIEGPFTSLLHDEQRVTVFTLAHKGKRIRVLATGVLPEQFREHFDGAVIGRWLDAGEARPILAARGVTGETEIFDARDVYAKLPDYTLGSADH